MDVLYGFTSRMFLSGVLIHKMIWFLLRYASMSQACIEFLQLFLLFDDNGEEQERPRVHAARVCDGADVF